jgi:hypothetical protein
MSLYHQIPKSSIMPELRKRFTAEELELIKTEVTELLQVCNTMDQFNQRAFEILKRKQSDAELKRNHQGNLESM